MNTSPVVPSRMVLTEAVRTNARLGHENLGFLSEKHGLAPSRLPILAMPESHRAWDQIVDEYPALWRELRLRSTIDALPILSTAPEELPDEYLLRASGVLSMLAHGYVRVQTQPPDTLPLAISQPWEEVTRRLGRHTPVLSYIDLIIYNWKLKDPGLADPMRVENLELLIPTVGNREEDVLYLTQIEIVAQSAPMIGQVVRAQEAVVAGDVESLEREMLAIIDGLRHVGEVSFQKIDPNPRSATFVDPVLLAKTVAPFAVPITPGVHGPSGTSSPIAHLMDVFLGRTRYETLLGTEALGIRNAYPPHWLDFLEAVGKISLRDFVEASGNKHLQGVFQALMDAYASDKGFLGIHRLKVYGYLETMFKMGRSRTIGGFAGLFREQAWAAADRELGKSRDERFLQLKEYPTFGLPKWDSAVAGTSDAAAVPIRHIPFDVSGTGVQYRPGDRCGVLAENSRELVDLTLRALRASGEEIVRLDRTWQAAVQRRQGYEGAVTLPLAQFLAYGKLRPVQRHIAKELYRLTASSRLKQIINERGEDQWELWDLLDFLYEAGFETRRLWKAEPWERESICKIIPPEVFRLYSISSAMPDAEDADPTAPQTLELTVRRLEYQTKETEVSRAATRRGTASNYLHRLVTAEAGSPRRSASLRVAAAPRFHLPLDPRTPIVMFAAGAGIAPFRGFVQERSRHADSGETWLFFGTRTVEEFFFFDEIEQWVGQGKLNLRVAFSAAAVRMRSDPSEGGRLLTEPGQRGRINAIIEDEQNARILWDLLRAKQDGGKGAVIYVCGQTGFAVSVMESLQAVIRRFSPGADELERDRQARETFYGLFAERRYLQDIFTTYSGIFRDDPNAFNASDVVLHNDEAHGFWFVIDGRVYDMTEFAQIHAGGFQTIRNSVGMDATRSYQNVMHHLNTEVDAMLGMYEIGHIRRLAFGQEWGVALGPNGITYVSLEDAFKAWVRYLYLIVEMENALATDYGVQKKVTTLGEDPLQLTPLKTQIATETHRRFISGYLDDLLGDDLQHLWAISTGLCAPAEDVRRLRQELDAIELLPAARLTRQCADIMQQLIDRMLAADGTDGRTFEQLRGLCALVDMQDRQCLSNLKLLLRQGVMLFEEHEEQTVTAGGRALVETLLRVPAIVREYYAGIAAGMAMVGADHLFVAAPSPPSGVTGEPRRRSAAEIRRTRAEFELPGHGMIVNRAEIGQVDPDSPTVVR